MLCDGNVQKHPTFPARTLHGITYLRLASQNTFHFTSHTTFDCKHSSRPTPTSPTSPCPLQFDTLARMSFSPLHKNMLTPRRVTRLAKPRGGRRPNTHGPIGLPRGTLFQDPGFHQTQPFLSQPNNLSTTNGAQRQGSTDLLNGSQSSQTSQSFPPFTGGNNTGVNTQFTAPSGGFSFSAGQSTSVNNPFANIPPPATEGFSGSIFNLPPQQKTTAFQRYSQGPQQPLFAAHSPFHNQDQNGSTPGLSKSLNNPFDVNATQQQQPSPSQQATTLFPPQQSSGNLFSQSQPSTTPTDIFGSFKPVQSQTSSTLFGLGNSTSQQPQSAKSNMNFFAQSPAPNTLTNVGLDPTSSAPEDHSMTSPDTSPQTTPSGTMNGANAQPQSSPSKGAATPAAGLSLFDRVSSPANQPSGQPSWSPNKDTSTSGLGGSIFDRVTKPSADTNAQSSPASNSTSIFKFPHPSKTSDNAPAPSGDTQPVKEISAGHSLVSTSESAGSLPVTVTESTHSASNASQAAIGTESAASNAQVVPSKKRKLGSPPDPPQHYTEDQKIQFITGWRLKMHDLGMAKRLRTDPPDNEKALLMKFYRMREEEIKAAKGGPLSGSAPGSKRKALEEQHEDEAQGKKTRLDNSSQDTQGALSNGIGTTSSQTSNLFQDILGSKKGPKGQTNGTSGGKLDSSNASSIQYPSLPTYNGDSSKQSVFSTKPSPTPSMLSPSKATSEDASTSLAFPGTPYQSPKTGTGKTTTSGSSNIFSFNPTPSSQAPIEAPKPSVFQQMPKSGASASSAQEMPRNPFTTPQSSSEPSTAAVGATARLVAPNFGVGTTPTSDSSPSSGGEATISSSKPPAFKVPTFNAGPATNFLSQFGKKAEKYAEEEKQKRKAEDFDSDEDDEASWNRKFEEEQRKKKQKFEGITKTKVAKLVDGTWQFVAISDDDSLDNATDKEKPSETPLSIFDQPRAPLTNGHNIFAHLSGEDSGAEGSKTGDADDEDEDGHNDGHDDGDEDPNGEKEVPRGRLTTAEEGKLLDRLSRATSPQRNSASQGMFDRKSKDEKDNPVHQTPNSDEKVAVGGFGRYSTSNPFGISTDGASNTNTDSLFKTPSKSNTETESAKTDVSPGGDRTWKADSPIKFGNGSSAPAVNVTAPSPAKTPFGGLFGASKSNTTPGSSVKPTSSIFSSSPTKTSPSGFGFAITPATAVKSTDTATPAEPAPGSTTPISKSSLFAKPAANPFAASSDNALSAKPATNLFSTPSDNATLPKPATTLFSTSTDSMSLSKPATSLFATPSENTSKPTTSLFAKSGTNFFSSSSNPPAQANPFLRSLAPPSNPASGATSRATSPGGTTGESANESNADNEPAAPTNEAQLDLMAARPGEEDEDVLFEVKAKAMVYDAASSGDSKWVVKGVGPLRVMKHRNTGKTRFLLRAEPTGRIAVNSAVLKDVKYESISAKAIRLPVANPSGKIDPYTFKVGKDEDAKELARILMESRPN